jgi:starch-binding outer membrane protein, SusD/RagB family
MKAFKYILLGFTAFASLSCEEFLKEEPEAFLSEDQYYKTQADAINAVNAVYFFLNSGGSSVQTPYNTLFNTGMNMASDDEDPGPGATNPDVRSLSVQAHSSTNLRIYELWQQHYAAIKKANVVLEKIPAIDFDNALKARLLGETKFLRALYYFNLVRLYGDIPLILEYQKFVNASDYAIAKSPSADIYKQIEKDLNEAAAVLPASYGSPDVGRATAGAAKALLAKVYLAEASLPLKVSARYQDAVSKAEEALSSADGGKGTYGYDLVSNYGEVFLPAFKNNKEHIFSAQFKSNSLAQGNNENPRAILSGIPGLSGNYAHMVRYYTEGNDKFFSIYKLFKPGDKRRDVTFVRNFTSPTNGKKYGLSIANAAYPNDSTPFWHKYWDPNSTAVTNQSAANVPIIRYAELLLIHAEAENEANGPTVKAYKSLNKVRTRAGLPNLTAGLSKDQFRDSVYLDRRLELTYEYQRWFDLIRQRDAAYNGTFVKNLHKVGKTNAAPKHAFYPIPQSEIDNNALLKQNPLWE